MKKLPVLLILATMAFSCNKTPKETGATAAKKDNFNTVLENYYEDRLRLFPLEATSIGDNRYNDQLPNDGSRAYLQETHNFYQKYLTALQNFKRENLNDNDRLSYDVLQDQLETALEAEKYHFEYLPFNQFNALPIMMGQLGSGAGIQPFKTVPDYDNWLKRVAAFPVWADTAIANFRKGARAGVVLPRSLVQKMLPQMQDLIVTEPTKSLFYGPITNIPPRVFRCR